MEKIVSWLRPSGKRFKIAKPMIYIPQYYSDQFEQHKKNSEIFKKFQKIRAENELIVFHHVRLVWTKKPDQGWIHWKANDRLLKAFRDFIGKKPDVKATLVLFEYGWDIEETKKLALELGINHYITWMPRMERKDIMALISLCDIGVGELEHSWLHYGAIYEFMALGIPIIHHRNDSLYVNSYPELYPMYSASAPSEIASILCNWVNNKDQFKETGKKAQDWLKKYVIEIPVNEYIKLIETKRDKRIRGYVVCLK